MEQTAAESARRRLARLAEDPVPPIPPRWVASPARAASRLLLKRYFDLELVGREHLPRGGPAIVIPNHPTYVDPWLVGLGTTRWITWMAWEDAFTWPVVGAFIRSMGAFPVNVERPQPSTIKAAVRVLEQGRALGVFFEGGRTKGPDVIDPPRRGGPRLALLAGAPVIPVSIAGARRLWPSGRPLPSQGKVVVRYHPPIDPRAVLPGAPARAREERLTELVSQAIRAGLPRDGRPRAVRAPGAAGTIPPA
ncbi:MAG: 1-acyl-sn-glycerol-3-phosphate acyltransferase [Planctomycetes bacterium]|nr:1-acyl-sn-glycerol-3-phosphate acyltransferase [Planctomycetota bacterium]